MLLAIMHKEICTLMHIRPIEDLSIKKVKSLKPKAFLGLLIPQDHRK